jgi:ABC-2 type transport system ATP-binding protein
MIYGLAQQGVTVFMTTHYLDEAEQAHRVAIMYNGRLIALDRPDVLRQETLAGELIELECEPADAALRVLQRLPEVAEATPFGLRFHVVLTAGTSPDTLRRSLERAGLRVAGVRNVEPSLEDAFIALLGRQGTG